MFCSYCCINKFYTLILSYNTNRAYGFLSPSLTRFAGALARRGWEVGGGVSPYLQPFSLSPAPLLTKSHFSGTISSSIELQAPWFGIRIRTDYECFSMYQPVSRQAWGCGDGSEWLRLIDFIITSSWVRF